MSDNQDILDEKSKGKKNSVQVPWAKNQASKGTAKGGSKPGAKMGAMKIGKK